MTWRAVLGAVNPGPDSLTHYPQYPRYSGDGGNIADNADIAHGSLPANPPPPPAHAPAPEDFEERAAIVEFEGRIPREWAEGFARLVCMPCPGGVPERRWRQFIDDAGRFLDRWTPQVAALGWTTVEVFGAHAGAPHCRYDCMGLVWLLAGADVLAVTTDRVSIRKGAGAVQTIYRRANPAPGAVPAWELGA